jgi:hypothetical protein
VRTRCGHALTQAYPKEARLSAAMASQEAAAPALRKQKQRRLPIKVRQIFLYASILA